MVIKNPNHNKPGVPTITASNDIGEKLIKYYIYINYKEFLDNNNSHISLSEYKELYKNDFKDFLEIDNFSAKLGGHFVGSYFTVELLREDIDKDPDNKKESYYCLRVQNNVRDILVKDNTFSYHLPQKLPMVIEPKNFIMTKNVKKLGGYLLNDEKYTEHIIKDRIGHEKTTTLEEDNLIVDMVNGLSKVPFKINVDTLDFIYKYGFEKGILINDDNIELIKFVKKPYKFSKDKNKELRSLLSQIQMERNILSISDIYSRVSKIYFPVRLDFRGRINCISDYFNYQKNDLAKGLLLFATPGVITKFSTEAINYFKGYGANLFGAGLDKKSLSYRIK
jgi:DNA-directed RNA polymerase